MRFGNLFLFLFLGLFFVSTVFAFQGTSTSYTQDVKMDVGSSQTNSTSSNFGQRFISGVQAVSSYVGGAFSGFFGILSPGSNTSSISMSSPVEGQEVVRGNDATLEDDLNLVDNNFSILSKVFEPSFGTGRANVNVSFYFNGTYLGLNSTNASGHSSYMAEHYSYPAGIYNVSVNYSTSLYTVNVSEDVNNISIVVYEIPRGPGNKGIRSQYVDNQTAILYFNVTKTNVSGTFFYGPDDINVSAMGSGATQYYPNNSYVVGYRVYNITAGQYESHVKVNKTLDDDIRWQIRISDDDYSTFLATTSHNDVDIVDGPLCGNGLTESSKGEECDDGNTDNGDGCSSLCATEGGTGTDGDDEDPDPPTCSYGSCSASDSSETKCDGNQISTRTCSGGCWSAWTTSNCDGGEVCSDAKCVSCDTFWSCDSWGECFSGDVGGYEPASSAGTSLLSLTGSVVEGIVFLNDTLSNETVGNSTVGNESSGNATGDVVPELPTPESPGVFGEAPSAPGAFDSFPTPSLQDLIQIRTCSNSKCSLPDRQEARTCSGVECSPSWKCDWTTCEEGDLTQSQVNCIDLNGCPYPGSPPEEVRDCPTCSEDWYCEYVCEEGDESASPKNCVDLNSCGTSLDKPTKSVDCGLAETLMEKMTEKLECRPRWECEEWGVCSASYEVGEALGEGGSLGGSQERRCIDSGGCASDYFESRDCDYSVAISTKNTIWCEEEYVELYDDNTGALLSRMKQEDITGFTNLKKLDFSFTVATFSEFCDYCSDGVKDYDETGIDCGGPNCPQCLEEVVFSNWLPYVVISLWVFLVVLLIIRWFVQESVDRRRILGTVWGVIRLFASVFKPAGRNEARLKERKIERFFEGFGGGTVSKKKKFKLFSRSKSKAPIQNKSFFSKFKFSRKKSSYGSERNNRFWRIRRRLKSIRD